MDRHNIFRKKSLDKVSSPDHLTDYIRILNPGILLIVIAAALIIFGAITWDIFGYKLDNRTMAVYVSNTTGYILIPEADDEIVTETTNIVCEGIESNVIRVTMAPVPVSLIYKDVRQNLVPYNLKMDDNVYFRELTGDFTGIADGTYKAEVQILVTDETKTEPSKS